MSIGFEKNWGCNLDTFDKKLKLQKALRVVEKKLQMRCHMSYCDSPRNCPENCDCRLSAKRPVKLDLNTALVWSTAEAVQRLYNVISDFFSTSKRIFESATEISKEVNILCHILGFHTCKYPRDSALMDCASNLISYIECMYTRGQMSNPDYMRFFDKEFDRFKGLE